MRTATSCGTSRAASIRSCSPKFGPGAALEAVARRAGIPVRGHDTELGRHPEPIETTIYFCCVECLQNAGEHAGPAAEVDVRCADRTAGRSSRSSTTGRVRQFDLAYDAEVLEADAAAQLTASVIEAFGGPTRWWTNGTLGLAGRSSEWTPLTTATFDTGVIGVSPERVLVVWFMDED